jgi:hypothetical protein
MTNEAQTLVGIIEDISIKDAPPESGKDWRLFAFKIRGPAGTYRYSTFAKGWPTNLIGGKTYRFTFTEKQGEKGMLRDLTSATLVDPSEFGAQPASNSQTLPPTDEAKADITPQPEFKSPSRSYDQNQDITRHSIERQISLKGAVELFKDTFAAATPEESTALLLQCADDLFAWLQDTSVEPSETPEERESDGDPAFFPDGPERFSGPPKGPGPFGHFADVGAFRKALKDNFGLASTPQVNKALDEAGLGPLAELGNLHEAYATLAAHRGEQGAEELPR